MIPLDRPVSITRMPVGAAAQIIELDGGITFQKRLRCMGLREGAVIRILTTQPLNGPLVVVLGGHQITIGRGMAERVLVRPLE